MYNPILDIDSYKASHFRQYPQGTEQVSSYIESRGGRYSHTIFFGLQRFIQKYLLTPITRENIEQAEAVLNAHGVPFNKEGWEYILEKHQGRLPVKIEAVQEGSLVPVKNVLVQITNTDPKCYWLPSYMETALLRSVWYPTTVSTLSFTCKQIIGHYLANTSDLAPEAFSQHLNSKLHDFGARGASSTETSAIGGLSHLVNFTGTDTVLSLLDAQEYYDSPMAGTSIPASEHSTITSWGQEREFDAYRNIIDVYLSEGKAVSLVCDSYDMDNALRNMIGSEELKNKIINSGGTLVVRPDSGDPAEIVLQTAQVLAEIFGARVNSKGFKILPDYIRIIQGDGINTNSIREICQTLQDNKFSIENIAFGMGAELQQKVNRDTCRFAMKTSAIKIAGVWSDVFKSPITDPKKTSKKGILKLIQVDGEYKTVRSDDAEYAQYPSLLETVFLNGELKRKQSFAEIKTLANDALPIEVSLS